MSDALNSALPRDENANRKTWCEPALTEYDVDAVTALQFTPQADGPVDFS